MTPLNWRNVPVADYLPYARSYAVAARKLARALAVAPGPLTDFDFCPVLSAYRHAVELSLKVLVLGPARNSLTPPPDKISVHKTRSLSWLAQFVVQMLTTLNWEFRTEGIESLAGFRALIEEANGIDPAFYSFRCPEGGTPAVLEFTRRVDALLDLLHRMAEAISAEFHLRQNTANPTVH